MFRGSWDKETDVSLRVPRIQVPKMMFDTTISLGNEEQRELQRTPMVEM